MADQANEMQYKSHPIQLQKIGVKEVRFQSNRPPSPQGDDTPSSFKISQSHGDYDHESKTIHVFIKVEIGDSEWAESANVPYSLKVEIVGEFTIDENIITVENLYKWAIFNAPIVLYPYLREHAYSVVIRCGFPPIIMPLLEVPTYKF